MRVIIDGYNLMAKMGGMVGTLEARRDRMIRILSRFQAERGHAVTLVFDGERGEGASESWQRIQGIEVIFSRMGEKADHVIQRLSEELTGECVVVSSDREVASYAETRGHVAVRSEDFILRLRGRGLEGPGPAGSDKDEDDDEVTGSPSTRKRGNPKKLSKAHRRREQKLKKL